jgi:hypothetical protein
MWLIPPYMIFKKAFARHDLARDYMFMQFPFVLGGHVFRNRSFHISEAILWVRHILFLQ